MEKARNHNEVWARVAEKVRRERRRLKLTIEQLAELADISPSFLSYLESNKKKASVKTLQRLAEALLLAPGDLLQPITSSRESHQHNAVREFARLVRGKSREEVSQALEVLRTLLKKPRTQRHSTPSNG